MIEFKYDDMIMKALYNKINLKFHGKEYAKQRVFVRSLLKKYSGEDILKVIDFCSIFKQKNFNNTFFLKENLDALIPVAKEYFEKALITEEEKEEVITIKPKKKKKTEENLLSLW